MRIALLYAPFLVDNHAFPPLSLPALTAALRVAGHTVLQYDLNIRYLRYLSTDAALCDLSARLRRRTAATLADGGPRTFQDRKRFCVATDGTNAWLPFIRARLAAVSNDLAALSPKLRKVTLERLATYAGLDAGGERETVELQTNEIMAQIAAHDDSHLSAYIDEHCLPAVLRFEPDVVGLSLMTEDQLYASLMVAAKLKQASPQTHVCLGGGLISAVADKVARSDGALFQVVDTCVAFDGDKAIVELVRRLETGESLAGTPNLLRSPEAGRVEYVSPQESGPLDQLPSPDFDGLDLAYYTKRVMPFYMTKGCSFGQCTYCSDPAYSSARNKSPEYAAAEIERLVERYQPETILFVDSYIHPRLLEGVATLLVERGVRVGWLTQTRMDRFLTPERIELFAKSGCRELWFGMETVNERLIRLIRKGTKQQYIDSILQECERYGIKVTLNVMIGFPGETEAEADDTCRFISEIPARYPALDFKCNTGFVYVPRLSAFGRQPEKFGIDIIEEFEWSPRLEWIPPAWRYQERYQRLEGAVFKRYFEDGQGVAAADDSSSPGTRVRIRDAVYIHRLDFNPVRLWRDVLADQARIIETQRERRCSKKAAIETVSVGTTLDDPAATTWAYVIGRSLTRRLVRLGALHLSLIDQIRSGCTADQALTSISGDLSPAAASRARDAIAAALLYLRKTEILEEVGDPVSSIRRPGEITPGGLASRSEAGVSVW